MAKIRTTLFMDEDLMELARVRAVQEKSSLSEVVVNALRNYLPPAIGVQFTPAGTVFHSGPTISTMRPNQSGLGVPTIDEFLSQKQNKDLRGVPESK